MGNSWAVGNLENCTKFKSINIHIESIDKARKLKNKTYIYDYIKLCKLHR